MAQDGAIDGALLLRLPQDTLGVLFGLGPQLADQLRRSIRLRPRIVAALEERLGALPEQLTVDQVRLLAMDSAALDGLAAEVGAVWLAPAVLRLLEGSAVRAFVASVGEPARRAALRWRTSAPVASPATTGAAPATTELAVQVVEAGAACLQAWCEAQPQAVGSRVRLLLHRPVVPNALQRAAGPALVERIATDAG